MDVHNPRERRDVSRGARRPLPAGLFVAIHDPREYQHVDLRGFGAQQGARAGIHRGAGGQDVVNQDDAAALDIGDAVTGDFERALHVGCALCPG